jgi:serine/threonine protein kinase/tetratricopeptide (TPR) repeat protein
MPLAPGTKLGRYEIRSILGTGGMGEVYLAHDAQLDRTIALKLLRSDVASDTQRMRRFIQEAKAASSLNHPNILTIHEIGQSDSIHFIATELIDGETLRERMTKARLRLTETLDIAIQVAGALAAAHAAGIVHRDIKPENIMVRRDGYVKVLDFGLAKLTEYLSANSDATTMMNTEPGLIMGTVSYMSPEQVRGQNLDVRTDIWSLGCVVYEMIAGRVPFTGETSSDVISLILQKEPLPLTRYSPEVPGEMERILTKTLRKDAEERYQTIKDLLLDLKTLKQELEFEAKLERSAPVDARRGELAASTSETTEVTDSERRITAPVGARETSSAEYIVREIKQHKKWVALVAVAFVATVAAFTYFYFVRGDKAEIDSIAVLPFANAGTDPNTEYLSEGMADSIANSLSQFPNLRVIPLSQVSRYKTREVDPQEVGRALGVRAVLTGSVIQRGNTLNIRTELIDVTQVSRLWGEQYNRQLSDILTVQEEIARDISEKLRLRLTGEHRERMTRRYTGNSEAYQAYIQGRYFWNKRTEESLKKGIEYFNEAIEKDPNYALAYAGLADSYIILGNFGLLPPRDAYPKSRAAATKALEIDHSLAEAHVSLAFTKHLFEWDWPGAESGFKRAIELNPNYGPAHQWYGVSLAGRGRLDEAIAEAKRAQEVDPLSLTINAVVGWMLYLDRQYDQAIEQERKTLEMDTNFVLAGRYLGLAYEQKRMYDEAIEVFQKASTVSGERPLDTAALGHAYAVAGKHREARDVLKKLTEQSKQDYFPAFEIALIYSELGEKDEAFAWLEKAYEERYPWLIHLNVDPRLDSLRSDPRFQDLVRRVGLPQ